MAVSIYSNSGIKNYGIKHFILDTQDDLTNIPTTCKPGSTAFITETSKYYMLNNQNKWIEVNLSASNGGSSGNEIDINEGDTVIFNGGFPY